jgi:LEA14-like dessication related protein
MGPQKPRVEVTSLEVRGISLTELDLAIGLSIENPNSFDILLKSVRYGLAANERSIASGQFTEGLTVLARGKGNAVVPVRIRLLEAQELAKSILAGAKGIKTVLSGAAIFDTPVGAWEMPFRQEQDLASP